MRPPTGCCRNPRRLRTMQQRTNRACTTVLPWAGHGWSGRQRHGLPTGRGPLVRPPWPHGGGHADSCDRVKCAVDAKVYTRYAAGASWWGGQRMTQRTVPAAMGGAACCAKVATGAVRAATHANASRARWLWCRALQTRIPSTRAPLCLPHGWCAAMPVEYLRQLVGIAYTEDGPRLWRSRPRSPTDG
jgi:hypothetical protein